MGCDGLSLQGMQTALKECGAIPVDDDNGDFGPVMSYLTAQAGTRTVSAQRSRLIMATVDPLFVNLPGRKFSVSIKYASANKK